MSGVTLQQLRRRVQVARGREAGDLLLAGGQVLNVFTGQVEAGNVVVADGWVAGVGPFDWPAGRRLDLDGRVIVPGYIDSHMHLESTLLLPAQLARLIVPRGTTTTISDSHEIGNVLGVAGIDLLLEASAGLPFDLLMTASSCVPCTAWEDAGAVLGPAEVEDLLRRPRVVGLAEMMDMPAVLRGDVVALAKVQAALSRGQAVDGHAPGLAARELMAYAAAGIRSDHEAESADEALARARLGMLVQVREGSIAHNLAALLPLLGRGELGDRWTLVTDDVLPTDLVAHGHVDGLLKRVVAAGVPAATAVRQATLVPARHYGLNDRGAVAPGYRADLCVVDDLDEFRTHLVLKDGRPVAAAGGLTAELPRRPVPAVNTVRIAPPDEAAFRLPLHADECPVIRILPGQLATRSEVRSVRREDGHWAFDPGRDVLLLASVERHRATGKVGLGLVSGFGLRRGAIGSSVAHDSHNLIVAGTNARDMLTCVRALAESGGGQVVADDGAVVARLPLPVAGLLSNADAETVCRQLGEVEQAARALGCGLASPLGVLSFLALPVIPELRVTARGLWDVVRQEMVRL